MRRFFLLLFSGLLVVTIVGGVAGVLGYVSHREKLEPIYNLGERTIRKGRRVLGLPTETVGLVERIETTYLTLRGKSYLMPDNDFINGGALTAWEDDVLVMHRSGNMFYLDAEDGLVLSGFVPPENGARAYVDLAEEKYPGRRTRIESIRYNDVEYINDAEFRGFVISYTYVDAENECYTSRVSKLALPDDVTTPQQMVMSADDWELVFETTPCLTFNETRELIVGYMAGGRMAYKSPGLLYLGSGEYHMDGIYRPDAGIQSDDSDYGKTIEINLITGEARHYSKGHRNLQGVEIDAEGRLWTTEHGMRGGDELNLIRDGENYGWPLENLGTLYSALPAPTVGRDGRHEVFAAPVYAWLPSAAVSSLALVDGFHETWDGDLLIGSLRGRTLFRARIRDDRLVFLETIPIGQRIRDVMQIDNERLALWLDTNELVIFEIEPRADPLDNLVAGLVEEGMSQDRAEMAYDVLVGCNECHSFEENVHGAGPSLHKVVGRPIASTAFANYSSALSSKSGVWDIDSLTAYLEDPGAWAEGTTMTGLGLSDEQAAGDVAKALEWLTRNSSTADEI